MNYRSSWGTAISYNHPEFLKEKLDELYHAKKIEFYFFISHKPEEDEKSGHIHLTFKTNGQIDSMALHDFLIEPDPNNKIPLQTIGFRKMHDNDNIRNGVMLYDKHDKKYLESIGQSRKYHYEWTDFFTSNQVEFDYYVEILQYPKNMVQEISEALDKGTTSYNLIKTGKVPLQQINFLKAFEKLRDLDKTERNGRSSHDYFICEKCGSIKPILQCHHITKDEEPSARPLGVCYRCNMKEDT